MYLFMHFIDGLYWRRDMIDVVTALIILLRVKHSKTRNQE
jgi:hypothetical protein